jgi:hypothetical protein
VALAYNWWSLFARLADPEHHREAITLNPAVGRIHDRWAAELYNSG